MLGAAPREDMGHLLLDLRLQADLRDVCQTGGKFVSHEWLQRQAKRVLFLSFKVSQVEAEGARSITCCSRVCSIASVT